MMGVTRSVFFGAVLFVSLAFANIDIGEQLPNPSLPDLEGVERSLIAADEVSVFVFFHPEQDRSSEVLRQLAEVKIRLKDKRVYWIGVVSDRFGAEAAAAALLETGIDLPSIIDAADGLYGAVGVRLYPSIGVTDSQGRLHAYLPYTKVNYMALVEAQIRHALGEINDDELEAASHPPEVSTGGDGAAAARNLRFAGMLLDSGKTEKALEKARAAVELDPTSAEAHAMVGTILVELGDCEGARESLGRAIELDDSLAAASQALEGCGDR